MVHISTRVKKQELQEENNNTQQYNFPAKSGFSTSLSNAGLKNRYNETLRYCKKNKFIKNKQKEK